MDPLTWIGGGAALGLLAAGWSHVKGSIHRVFSRFIQTVEIGEDLKAAVKMYLQEEYKKSSWGDRLFEGWTMMVRPLRRRVLVALELPSLAGATYWKGWRWIYFSYEGSLPGAGIAETPHNRRFYLSFIRIGFDIEEFINASVEIYNRHLTSSTSHTRHMIAYHSGSAGKPASPHTMGAQASPLDSKSGPDARQYRLLKWKHDELGQQPHRER